MGRAEELKANLTAAEPAFGVKGNEGRRQLMEYCGPQKRTDNCKGCACLGHTLVNTGSWNESEAYHCKVGGFTVAAGGVCHHWEKAK